MRGQLISTKHSGPDVGVRVQVGGFYCGKGPITGSRMLNLSPWQRDISPEMSHNEIITMKLQRGNPRLSYTACCTVVEQQIARPAFTPHTSP